MNFNIVFIPGGAVSPKVSQRIVDVYSRELNCKIDLIHYPEYTNSNFIVTLENEANYFRNIIKQKYNKQPICVIGFSMGGYFALDLASQKDLNFQKVILISPFINKPRSRIKLLIKRIWSFLQEQGIHDGIVAYGLREALEDTIQYGKQTKDQFKNIILKMELTSELTNSNSKKLIIIGKKDIVLPKYSAKELNMRNANIVYVDGAHDILTNHSLKVIPLIDGFLKQN